MSEYIDGNDERVEIENILTALVQAVEQRWSPEQIQGWLELDHQTSPSVQNLLRRQKRRKEHVRNQIIVKKEGKRSFAAYVDSKNMRRIGESRGEAAGKVLSDLIESRDIRLEDGQIHMVQIKQE